jgi:hypothetical protein
MSPSTLIRRGLLAGGLALLCSCTSSRQAPPPAAAAAVPPDLKTNRPAVTRPVSVAPEGTASRISPTRAEQITQLVRAGTLVETSRDCLIFSLERAPRNSPGGLFEDAIVLSRLRGQLKKISGLPDTVAGTATVQSARAYLKLSDQITAELAARAIDSALKTDGVSVVHVTTAPEVRL